MVSFSLGELVCAVIPALNEEKNIPRILRAISHYVDNSLVVDDGSTDRTVQMVQSARANVLANGYIRGAHLATLFGVKSVSSEIIVTIDADGQHPPKYIPRLLKPIIEGKADFVIGRRNRLQPSEKPVREVFKSITNGSKELDIGSGFRAFRRSFLASATPEDLGLCGCGSFILFAMSRGASIAEVPFQYEPRMHGISRFARTRKYDLHRRQAIFLTKRYGNSIFF